MLAKYAIYIEKSLDIDEEIKDAHDDDDDDQDNDDDDAYVDNNSQIDDDDDDDDDNDPAPEPDTDYYNPYLSSKKEIYDAFVSFSFILTGWCLFIFIPKNFNSFFLCTNSRKIKKIIIIE